MRYNYLITGLHIGIDLPFEMKISEESPNFIQDAGNPDVDVLVQIRSVNEMHAPDTEGTPIMEYRFFTDSYGSTAFRLSQPGQIPYAKVRWDHAEPHEIHGEYVLGYERRLALSRNILSLINLETVLLKHDRILLHSSFIRWQNQGILFTAPSGTGKSTQAKLWEEYEQAEVLNGDRAALVKTPGCWTAWGLPYAGTSGIYRNESAPISAIVVLRQSMENHMRRLSPREAVRYIYPELTNHRWDPWFADRVWNLMSELICEVPIYLLECRPDREAVQLVKKTILKGE